jgi:hypothetical protein
MAGKLSGSAIQSNTITVTQLSTTTVTTIVNQTGPRVTSLVYPGNDTAGNTVGGQTVYINGSGFETNNAIYINGNAVPSKSFISASNLSFTTPALSAGIYPVYVINTDSGSTAIFVPGYIASAEPAWVTSAGSLNSSQDEASAWSYSLSATGDAPITYALAVGSSLPSGISLAANGLVSGTLSSPPGTETTYTFSVVATDAQNQDSTRQFTVTTTSSDGVLFANNVLLIHADGTNNQNNHAFLDSSNNNFTITRNGNATQGSFSPFSQTGWSVFFDGTSDTITYTGGSSLNFGTSDFTIELWVNMANTNTFSPFLRPDDTGAFPEFGYDWSTSELKFQARDASITSVSTTAVVRDVWNHIAVSRSGTSLRLFVNGTQVGSTVTNSTNFGSTTGTIRIGGSSFSGSHNINGYLSNFRVVKGTALYTSTFTPSTTPLTAITNTSLLICQSNRFIDNSTNAFTITHNGDVSIQPFSPFATTSTYSTANVSGSAYFDGDGDYLALASNDVFNMGTGNFTLECYYYHVGGGTALYPSIFSSTDWSGGGVGLRFNNTGYANKFAFFWNGVGDPWIASSATYAPYQWNHVALTRSGNNFTLWVNGQSAATGTNSGSINFNYNGGGPRIGWGPWDSSNGYLKGIISNLRLIKGTALYTTSFTPPIAPLTNVENTSLLCNFTNAGIFDQTAKNVIETAGDAKVSTAQYKYGTASMFFDGTGDRLAIPASQSLTFGTGNFTIEYWMYPISNGTGNRMMGNGTSPYGANDWSVWPYNASGKLAFDVYNINASAAALISTTTMSPNNWYHVAIVRSGTSFLLFINGTQEASTTSSASFDGGVATPLYIGDSGFGEYYNGYIDDLRITKGYARYTSNFTPPAAAFKDK